MNEDNVKYLIRQIRGYLDELEAEIRNHPENYNLNVDYDDIVSYYQNPANAEEGL